MKFFVFLFLINLNFCKIDPIFKIKADFIQKGGKTIFALNPDKLKPTAEDLKIQAQKKKKQEQKKQKESKRKLFMQQFQEKRLRRKVERKLCRIIKRKMIKLKRKLGIMDFFKAALKFIFAVPIFIYQKIPDTMKFLSLPMQYVARERWIKMKYKAMKKIRTNTFVILKHETFFRDFIQLVDSANDQLEKMSEKMDKGYELIGEKLQEGIQELQRLRENLENDQLNFRLFKIFFSLLEALVVFCCLCFFMIFQNAQKFYEFLAERFANFIHFFQKKFQNLTIVSYESRNLSSNQLYYLDLQNYC